MSDQQDGAPIGHDLRAFSAPEASLEHRTFLTDDDPDCQGAKKELPRFGIADWGGALITELGEEGRMSRARHALDKTTKNILCKYKSVLVPGFNCSKAGAVCSLVKTTSSGQINPEEMVTTCPNRFFEDNIIVNAISQLVLDAGQVAITREVPLYRTAKGTPTAKLDLLIRDTGDEENWCGVENQSVYFQGRAMSDDFQRYAVRHDGVHRPDKIRNPDFRSSSAKRLAPQLRRKVPLLRSWGKKMVLVVDQPFHDSLGTLVQVGHAGVSHDERLADSDIFWIVPKYNSYGKLLINQCCYTTLDATLAALDTMVAMDKAEFQKNLARSERSKKAIKLDVPARQVQVSGMMTDSAFHSEMQV